MPTKTKREASNLIRVRNNQRRSRARRREYVAELERKVHECEAQGLPPCTPHVSLHDTILRLEQENRSLRELLAHAGVKLDLVALHLAAEGGVLAVADNARPLQSSQEIVQESSSAAMEPTADEASIPGGSDEVRAESFLRLPADDFDMLFEPLPSIGFFERSYAPPVLPESLPFPYAASLALQDVNPLYSAEPLLSASSQSSTGTTLCSVAYKSVCEHNKRGVDIIEIGIRLWNGFVKGDGDGGCRVDNELLSSVLEYIKG